jgi:Heavy-metal resistance
MGLDKNNKIYVVTIVLVLLNLALLFTIWYSRITSVKLGDGKKEVIGQLPLKTEYGKISIQQYLREELQFTTEQVNQFNQMQAHHLSTANTLRQRMYHLRNEIMTLLFNDNPNKSRIEELSYQLGLAHEKLEKEIFFHFMDLMAQCRPDQKENLKTLLRKVFETYRPPLSPIVNTNTQKERQRISPTDTTTLLKPTPPPSNRSGPTPREGNRNHQASPRKGSPVEDRVKRDLETLAQRLSLTSQQLKQVEDIVRRFHVKEEEIRDSHGEDRDAIKNLKDQSDRQIEAVLTPQQLQQFRKFKEETRKK